MNNYVYLLLAVLSFTACKSNKKKLVWADEFNYAGAPDTTKWSYDLGDGCPNVCGWGNNELEFYTNDSKNIRVENNLLVIEAHHDSLGGKPFTSARMVSKKKGDWRYGRIEAKAKLPRGKGTWPAIWMLSTDWEYGGWPQSGEIDIMEHVGFNPEIVHGTVHTDKYNGMKGTQKGGTIPVPGAQDSFHLYAVEWSETKIDFFVDDKLYFTFNREENSDFTGWPFDKPFHLIMNLAVGGNWGGKEGVDYTIWPQRMEVDYVRVYQ